MFNDLMAEVGAALNLKEHVVGQTQAVQKTLFGPCDIEGHRGRDGRYYVVDLARLFPPEVCPLTSFVVVGSL